MDVVIGIVGLAIIVGFVALMQKGMSSLGRTANQKVFDRKGHHEGQNLVSKPWIFQPNASVDEIKSAIFSTVRVACQSRSARTAPHRGRISCRNCG